MIVIAIVKSSEKTLHESRKLYINKMLIGFGGAGLSFLLFYFKITVALLFVYIFFIYSLFQLKKIFIFNHGIRGERLVLKALKKLPDEYLIYNDLTIQNGEHKAQIDHLVISPYGIFCIETKNMKGVIYGNENDQKWTQMKVGRRGGKYSREFYNPCKQCLGHINALKIKFKKVGLGDIWIQPMVVFTRRITSSICVTTKNTPVIKVDELLSYIKRSKSSVLSDEKIKRVEGVLNGSI